jgi:hypothetical protein
MCYSNFMALVLVVAIGYKHTGVQCIGPMGTPTSHRDLHCQMLLERPLVGCQVVIDGLGKIIFLSVKA